MRELPRGLQRYLWLIYLACIALIIGQLHALTLGPRDVPALASAAVFVVLAYIGERTSLHVRGAMTQSLSTSIHVAAILILPQPYPLLITLLAVLISQAVDSRSESYKRAFNIAHPTLTVGLSNILLSLVLRPTEVLHPHHLVDAIPALTLLLLLYYTIDVGMMLGVLSLAEGKPLWQVWRHTYFPTLLPELAAITIGVLGTIAWQYDPLALTLLVLPVSALRIAYQAIRQAEVQETALRRRGEQLEAVLFAGQHLRLQHTPADLLQPLAEAACAIVAAAAVTAYLRDEEDTTLLKRVVLAPAAMGETDAAGPAHLPVSICNDGVGAVEQEGGLLLLPLELEGAGVVGLLHMSGVPPGLGHDDRDALVILATQAAIALQNAQMHERALAQASEDGLTGLLNHRAFQTRLEEEVARARRGGHPLALIMVDLDDFRRVNNTYGHQIGDATLKAIAGVLHVSVRTTDVPARYGGDEFAVILPETEMTEALEVAGRVHAAIAALTVLSTGVPIRVNTSVGVAALPLHARSREELVRAADQAAYAAKHAGKGRIGRPEDAPLMLDDDPAVLTKQLKNANLATVEALAAAVDAKDPYTRGHSQRVSAYAGALAGALGWPEAAVARVRLAGLLHDVGKIGVPDAILTKPGALDAGEFDIIKQHPEIGERMLGAVPFLRAVLPAVRHHHERWDGQGYPDGLAGGAIPRDAAILMVADSFDAMTSSRTYRPALPLGEARRRVREGSGVQFDPTIVAAFEQALAEGELTILPSTGAIVALPAPGYVARASTG